MARIETLFDEDRRVVGYVDTRLASVDLARRPRDEPFVVQLYDDPLDCPRFSDYDSATDHVVEVRATLRLQTIRLGFQRGESADALYGEVEHLILVQAPDDLWRRRGWTKRGD